MGAQTLPSSVLRGTPRDLINLLNISSLSVQTFLESMGKILFLREGRVPLRLTPAQVESRKQSTYVPRYLFDRVFSHRTFSM